MAANRETMPDGHAGFGSDADPDAAQAQLVCFEGCRRTIDLAAHELSIGRHPDSGLQLDSERVSRQHARIVRDAGDYHVEDLGSINGTLLNGRRIAKHRREPLHHKDVIQVCEYRMLFLDWRGLATKLGLATIRLDSDAIRREADAILGDFLRR